jgi:hypothetical protein
MQFNRLDKMFIAFIAVFVAVMAGTGYYLQSSMQERLTAHLKQIENEIMLAVSIFLYVVPFMAAGMMIFLVRYLKKVTPAP